MSDDTFGPHERVIACPHAERHHDAQPAYEPPRCPYCTEELDVIGVDTVVQGGGTEQTATGLLCPCGYLFRFNPHEDDHPGFDCAAPAGRVAGS